MQIRLQIIFAVLLLIVLFVLVQAIRKKRLEVKYSLSWLFVVLALLIIDCFPQIMKALAKLLGIQVPSNMLFLLGFCFFMIIVYTLTVAVSRLSTKNKILAQEVAILKKQIEDIKERLENS